MHCTVKKAQLIVDGGNDYLVTVKENQPRLLAQLETLAQQNYQSRFADVEKTRGELPVALSMSFLTLLELTAIGQDSKV